MSRPSSRAVTTARRPSVRITSVWKDIVVVGASVGTDVARRGTAGSVAAEALLTGFDRVMAESGLGALPRPVERAIVVGTHSGAIREVEGFLDEVAKLGAHLANAALFPMTVMNAAAGVAAIRHGCEGPNITLTGAPAAAFDAMAYAADVLTTGRASLVFAGGFETDDEGPRLMMVHALAALTTAQGARERGARPMARLLAGCAIGMHGDDGDPPHDAVADALEAAHAADEAVPIVDRSRMRTSHTPVSALVALGKAIASTASGAGEPPARLAVTACNRWGGTALVIEPVRTI